MRSSCPKCGSQSFKLTNGYLIITEGPDFIPLDGEPFERRLTMIGDCNVCGCIFDQLKDKDYAF